jgi:antirestriction protein ArdC
VKKGSKFSLVIFFKQLAWEDDNGDEQNRAMIRASSVFNVDQLEGYEIPTLSGDPKCHLL